eukprot:g3873.t1
MWRSLLVVLCALPAAASSAPSCADKRTTYFARFGLAAGAAPDAAVAISEHYNGSVWSAWKHHGKLVTFPDASPDRNPQIAELFFPGAMCAAGTAYDGTRNATAGAQLIVSEAACQDAAGAAYKYAVDKADRPAGCYRYHGVAGSAHGVYFNRNLAGAVSPVARSGFTSLACSVPSWATCAARANTYDGAGAEAAGHAIVGEAACKEAAGADYKYALDKADRPAGCYRYKGASASKHGVYFNANLQGAVAKSAWFSAYQTVACNLPVVLYAHGAGDGPFGQSTSLDSTKRQALADRGYVVVHGASCRSAPFHSKCACPQYADDLAHAADTLRGDATLRAGVPALALADWTRVGALGFSNGGTAAARLAAATDLPSPIVIKAAVSVAKTWTDNSGTAAKAVGDAGVPTFTVLCDADYANAAHAWARFRQEGRRGGRERAIIEYSQHADTCSHGNLLSDKRAAADVQNFLACHVQNITAACAAFDGLCRSRQSSSALGFKWNQCHGRWDRDNCNNMLQWVEKHHAGHCALQLASESTRSHELPSVVKGFGESHFWRHTDPANWRHGAAYTKHGYWWDFTHRDAERVETTAQANCTCRPGYHEAKDISCSVRTHTSQDGVEHHVVHVEHPKMACLHGDHPDMRNPTNPDKCLLRQWTGTKGVSFHHCRLLDTEDHMSCECCDCAGGVHHKCPAGKFRPSTSDGACQACGAGRYTDAENDDAACKDCAAGHYASGEGTTHCTKCELGKYQEASKQTGCVKCAKGRYAALAATVACTACQLGRYQGSEGRAACASCFAGKFTDATASERCKTCPENRWQQHVGQSFCRPVMQCTVVEYETKAYTTSSDRECASHTICDVKTQWETKPAHTHSDRKCARCPEGHYCDGTLKTQCPKGTAQDAIIPEDGSVDDLRQCDACTPGKYAGGLGWTACQDCPKGFYEDVSGGHGCKQCDKGEYADVLGLVACKDCAMGTYAGAFGMHNCVDCATGQHMPAEGASKCVDCPAGQFGATTKLVNCVDCAAEYFQPERGQIKCEETVVCETHQWETVAHTTSSDRTCTDHTICHPGRFMSVKPTGSSDRECENCAAGEYQPHRNVYLVCEACQPGKYRNDAAASSEEADACTVCAKGTKQAVAAQLQCEACEAGQSQDETGKTVCDECAAGHHQPDDGKHTCLHCVAGKYRTDAHARSVESLACEDCATGEYQAQIAQLVCTACEAGKVQPLKGKIACSACAPGKYQPDTGKTVCSDCLSGQHQAAHGQTECASCSAGKYRNSEPAANLAHVACTACAAGEFQPSAGELACVKCPTGTHRNSEVASSVREIACTACDAGKYAGVQGKTSCDDCLAGRAQAAAGSDDCDDCAAGTVQPAAGEASCPACVAGKVQPSTAKLTCDDCVVGRSQATAGKETCDDCAAGKAQPSTAAISCDACATGKFQPLTGKGSCTACPKGTRRDVTKLASNAEGVACAHCTAGTYAATAGLTTCTACAAEHYSGAKASQCLPWAECESGVTWDQDHPPSATKNRNCKDVNSCDDDEYMSQAPTLTDPGTCSAHTTCTGAQYESKDETTTSDRECSLKVCTCDKGDGYTGAKCDAHDTAQCESCDDGYFLDDTADDDLSNGGKKKKCTAWEGACDNGKLKPLAERTAHDQCGTCDDHYELDVTTWTCNDIDECASDPCGKATGHGASCADSKTDSSIALGTHVCKCATGWATSVATETNCAHDVDECLSDPCGIAEGRGGYCHDSKVNSGIAPGAHECGCADGWKTDHAEGAQPNCNHNIDECAANPCLNGGECTDGIFSFTCACKPGFKGDTCAEACTCPNVFEPSTVPGVWSDKSAWGNGHLPSYPEVVKVEKSVVVRTSKESVGSEIVIVGGELLIFGTATEVVIGPTNCDPETEIVVSPADATHDTVCAAK